MAKKNTLKKLRSVFGLVLLVVIVGGIAAGTWLAGRIQEIRQQASGGAVPTSAGNVLHVCVMIEAHGQKLEEFDQVPTTTFTLKAGPVTTNWFPDQGILPSDYESQLDEISIHIDDLTNATLENGVNVRCVQVPKNSQRYLYRPASISSPAEWDSLQYNDVYTDNLTQFFEYSGQLFDDDPANDSQRNGNADGHIGIGGRTDRKLVILARLKSPLVTPTPTPSPTPSPTPEPTVAAQSEPEAETQVSQNQSVTTTGDDTESTGGTAQLTQVQSTPTPAPTAVQLAQVQTTPTPVPTLAPTSTPTPAPTQAATGGTSSTATPTPRPTATPTPTPTAQSQTSQTQIAQTSTPTPSPSSVLLADTTGIGGTQNSLSTSSSSLSSSTDSARTVTTLDASDAPVSGSSTATLALLGFGLLILTLGGVWLLDKR